MSHIYGQEITTPDDQVREKKICSKSTDEQAILTAVDLILIFTVISSQIVNAK